ncbi:hypothetical protein B0H13DRAFT_2394912 [Mycena leptocephala]|nr:hypothetical protein B0H13DRAFT_2394912 [Mycena leptocephala]
MEILRMERNNKREERRKAGGKDVSEDESDDLAPYLMVVPSGENPQPSDTPDIPSESTGQGSSVTKLLFDDNVAEKNTFRAHDDTIPAAIYSLAKNGISPPLTLFLPASLERIRTSNVKTVKHGTGETTKVTVIDLSDFPSEETLDQATWLTCYNTFLTFLDTAAGVKILQGFARHYNRILADPELATWFPAYRNFDRTIRARFFTIPYIVDIDSPEYRSALQLSFNWLSKLRWIQFWPIQGEVGTVNLMTETTLHPAGPRFAFGVGERATVRLAAQSQIPTSTDGGSSYTRTGMGFFGSPTMPPSALGSTSLAASLRAVITQSTSVLSAETLSMERLTVLETDFNRVVTPYQAEGWYQALRDCHLLDRYPNLIHDIPTALPLVTLQLLLPHSFPQTCPLPTSTLHLLIITSLARSPLVA